MKPKKKKNKCVKNFQECKKAQDDAVDGVSTCKKINKCGGVLNKTEAQRLLDILRPLKEALANPKFMDALKKLGLHEGPGDDGNVPAGRIRWQRLRNTRQANEGEECNGIVADWKAFNTSGNSAVPAVDSDVDATETTNTIAALKKINERENLEAGLQTCKKETSRQIDIQLNIVQIRFYLFWCGFWRVFVVEVKIIILEVSFGLGGGGGGPSPSPSPSVSTVAPPGGLEKKFQEPVIMPAKGRLLTGPRK